MPEGPAIIPYFSYVDTIAAMNFLKRAFGLKPVQAFDGPDGRLMRGEMRHCAGMTMMGSIETAAPKGSPGVYLMVRDVGAHFGRAKAGGAEIAFPTEDTEFGMRRYCARDPEDHEWSFGTYARPAASADQIAS